MGVGSVTLRWFVCISATLIADTKCVISVHPRTLEERHTITTRLARAGEIYTQHDVAVVLHERQPNSFHPISKRDLRQVTGSDGAMEGISINVSLQSASGSELHLRLKKRSLFDQDTVFIDHVGYGRVKRAMPQPQDCYATGDVVMDGISEGSASVATCNGLHGRVVSNGKEYYIHPVDHVEGENHVHLFSRSVPDTDNEMNGGTVGDDSMAGVDEFEYTDRSPRSTDQSEADTNNAAATRLVVETAVFVDSSFWHEIHAVYPGREDEFVLLRLAEANAIFGHVETVGYDLSLKIKLYENWIVNPDGYDYQPNRHDNTKGRVLAHVRSACAYTKQIYEYDLHFMLVDKPKMGKGWALGKVCTDKPCVGAASWSSLLIAHEIAHAFKVRHHNTAHCPDELKELGKGVTSGVKRFSPCNKYELHSFISSGGGQCLYEETREITTSDEYVNLPHVYPGQYNNPDDSCKLMFGEDYELFRPFEFKGDNECVARMCINRNEESPEHLKIQQQKPNSIFAYGYTCGHEMFCDKEICQPWNTPKLVAVMSPSRLRKIRGENHWTEWSQDWSPCSHSCGKGVQLKRRRCIFSSGPFLSPHCPDSPIQVRLCNEQPCSDSGDSIAVNEQRKASGDEVCDRFLRNNVTLEGRENYLNQSSEPSLPYWSTFTKILPTKSCFLACTPAHSSVIDSIYPDGTPCTNDDRRERFGITFRCVQGACLEFSGCPDNEKKDGCGLCGSNPTRCIDTIVDQSNDVPKGERKLLATLSAGTKYIDIRLKWRQQQGVWLELCTTKGEKIFGGFAGGRFRKAKYTAKPFANTTWDYSYLSFLRSDGPIDQDLLVKAYRHDNPIHQIFVTYLLPESS